mgnify:CR=1 FL=1
MFQRPTVSLANALRSSNSGIITEHKRRSPSKSVINQNNSVADVAVGYEKAGACGMSVLTDGKYFGGSLDDLLLARAAILTRAEIKALSEFAKQLHLDVLLEVHDEEELQKSIMPSLDMLGVNNRNLKTFEVSLDTSKTLSKLIPDDFVKVSESGISSIEAIQELKPYGYQGFLIGENFMKTDNPGLSALQFIKSIK